MDSLTIAFIAFACVFGGALVGMSLHSRLPDHHLAGGSSDAVKLVMGLVGTLSALVLGLLVATAKNGYDAQRSNVAQIAAGVVELDRILANYGPDTKDVREALQQAVIDSMVRIWQSEGTADETSPLTRSPARSPSWAICLRRLPGRSCGVRLKTKTAPETEGSAG